MPDKQRITSVLNRYAEGEVDLIKKANLLRAASTIATFEHLEKQYCERLGELARLSEIVCNWVTAQNRTSFIDEDTLSAVTEIMEYVEAVRPE